MWTTTTWCIALALFKYSHQYEIKKGKYFNGPLEMSTPLVIAHRGASGYVPEHTLGSYALAMTMGADYVEPDLVMTKDGHLVARHDNELSLTTDVYEHPEFASRRRTQTVDRNEITGWFTEDFTLAELKTLRAVERIPDIRPGNARMDKVYEIPTFQEIVDLVKGVELSQGRNIGVYPEIKHSTHFRQLGLAIEKPLVDILHKNGYLGLESHVYIQSFEVKNLQELKNMTAVKLLQLYETDKHLQPIDQIGVSNLTYGEMASAEGLLAVAKYAYAVGPDKTYIIPRDENNRLTKPTTFVADAHNAGLKVHPYTFRAENTFLPAEFRTADNSSQTLGNLAGEIEAYFAAGIDGLFSDQPNVPVSLKRTYLQPSLRQI